MPPWFSAACTIDDCIRIISMSKPLAVKPPHSLAARSGRAVMVKPALEILAFARCSWAPKAGYTINSAIPAAKTDRFISFLLGLEWNQSRRQHDTSRLVGQTALA